MPICTITGLSWKQSECPPNMFWPHPALSMGTSYVIPADWESIPYRQYILMVGACLSTLVRANRAILKSAISNNGKFPIYCSLDWLVLNIPKLQASTDLVCSLSDKVFTDNYPSLVIDHNLRLDGWLEEIQYVQDQRKHESLEYFKQREVTRIKLALEYSGREHLLVETLTNLAAKRDADTLRAAYIEKVCFSAHDGIGSEYENGLHVDNQSLKHAYGVMIQPTGKSAFAIRQALKFAETFAPHTTLGEYAQYKALITHLSAALEKTGEALALSMPNFVHTPSIAKANADNVVLSKLQERLAAMIKPKA
jgi:hypothetical protein